MDKAFQAVGELGTYQKKLIIVIFLSVYTCFQPVVYSYMSKAPEFLCQSQTDPTKYEKCKLNSEMCQQKETLHKDKKSSVDNWAYEFDLYCDREFYLPLISSSFFIGGVLCNYFFSSLPDKYGRKKLFQILLACSCFFNMNFLFLLGPAHIIIIYFLSGISSFAESMAIFIVTEYLPPRLNGLLMGLMNSLYPLMGVIFGFYFLLVNNKTLLFFIIFASHAYITYLSFTSFTESPRWLKAQGRKDDCIKTLEEIARQNGRLKEWDDFLKSGVNIFDEITETKKEKNYSVIQILSYPSQKKKTFILCYLWMGVALNFFGIILNLSKMKGNYFRNSIFAFIGETVGDVSSGYIADKFGRVKVIRFGSLFGSIFFLLFIFSSGFVCSVFLFLAMISFASLFNVITIYTPEAFPTTIRSTMVGFLFFLMRISPIAVGPLNSVLGETMDYVFCVCGFIIFICSFHLVETLGVPLPDDIPEEEQIKEKFLLEKTIEKE